MKVLPPKTKRNPAAPSEHHNGTRINGLPYIEAERRKVHPKRAKDWDETHTARVAALDDGGPGSEADLLRALDYERNGPDGELFHEAFMAESQSWRRPR